MSHLSIEQKCLINKKTAQGSERDLGRNDLGPKDALSTYPLVS